MNHENEGEMEADCQVDKKTTLDMCRGLGVLCASAVPPTLQVLTECER